MIPGLSKPRSPSTPAFDSVDLGFVLAHEGMNQPGKWPGGDSGITIGYGYDLGQQTAAIFAIDWRNYLKPDHLNRLTTVIGLKGDEARKVARGLRDITISREAAAAVFNESSLPRYWGETRQAFPGVEMVHRKVQLALFSLVYNRGPSLEGVRRLEMRNIRSLVALKDYAGIAAQLRLMKRLWENKGLPGLLRRREEEAELCEAASKG